MTVFSIILQKKWDEVYTNLQSDLNNFISWGDRNALCLNVDKTKAPIVAKRHTLNNLGATPPFIAENRLIGFITQYSYLGIILESEINFQQTFLATRRRVTNKIYKLSRPGDILINILLLLYINRQYCHYLTTLGLF